MQSKGRVPNGLRLRSAALVTAIMAALSAVPTFAQNTLPTTVREAAASGAVVPHQHAVQSTPKARLTAPWRTAHASPQDNALYSNGPTNGTNDAYFIDVYVVSDSYVPNGGGPVTSFDIALWTPAGATPLTADWSMGTSSFGSDLGSGSGAWTSLTLICSNGGTINGGPCGGGFGYDVYDAKMNVSSNVNSGQTYWLTLTGTTDNFGGRDAWDLNSGPSLAYHNLLGAVPSESFTISGSTSTTPPPPTCFDSGGDIQIIHDFTPQEGQGFPPSGVTIDKAGNLYSTTPKGGDSGDGLGYKLGNTNEGWIFTPLYSFTGGANGANPSEVIMGPDGSLYGTAAGGIQNCESDQSQWCGFVFNLKPYPTACLRDVCRTEKVIYAFSGDSDGFLPSVSAFDQQGNLYGTTFAGGGGDCSNGCGTVFKLTPGATGWSKTMLYSFTGGSDGSTPTQVLVGKDGNLYGTANSNNGEIFQLTPSGGGWTLNVLHTFQGDDWGSPAYLVQDSSGNLYGIVSPEYFNLGAKIFMLSKSGGDWVFSDFVYQHPGDYDEFRNLTIDAAGHLYGTGTSGYGCAAGLCRGSKNLQMPFFMDYVFVAWYADGAWNYYDLIEFPYEVFDSGGALAVANGSLYGTTGDCGKYNAGTIWQLSP